MTKSKIAFAFLLVGISSAQAAPAPRAFQSMDGTSTGCKLVKYAGGKWARADEVDLNGKTVAAVTPSKANGDFSNFKFGNQWYAAKNECLIDALNPSSLDAMDSISSSSMPQYAIEVKLQKYLMMGSNLSAATTTTNGINSATSAYTSVVGFDGRFLYKLSGNKYLFLDISNLPASQTTNYTGADVANTSTSNSIFMANIGLKIPFAKPIFGLKPYVAGALGYAKLTGTEVGPITTVGGSPLASAATIGVSYSGSSVDLSLEAGLVKEFNQHWNALISLGFTYLSLNPKVDQANALYNVGDTIPSRGYSHLTLAIGAGYNF